MTLSMAGSAASRIVQPIARPTLDWDDVVGDGLGVGLGVMVLV